MPTKTSAVSRLLSLVPEFDHLVYSLNRIGPARGIHALPFGDHHRAVAYGAPPLGVLHRTFMFRLARWIMADIEERDLAPVAVHAHKLSVEALVGDKIAGWLGVPLIVSCQGNSDLKILGAKPELRKAWSEIWQGADWVLPFAPWTAEALEARLGQRSGPLTILPCPTEADQIIDPKPADPIIRTAFNLDHYANKNAQTVIQAAIFAADQRDNLKLEIIGTGSPTAFAQIQRMIHPYEEYAQVIGPVANQDMQALLNQTACFVMPSTRESYGMVFAEALLAGCPVIHGAGNGISGYFPGSIFARPARPNGALGLSSQLLDMVDTQEEIKSCLADAQKGGSLDLLRRPAIAERYRKALYTSTEIEPPKPKKEARAVPKAKFSKVR